MCVTKYLKLHTERANKLKMHTIRKHTVQKSYNKSLLRNNHISLG